MNKRKWGILCLYRQPSLQDSIFEKEITTCLDKMYINFDHVKCIGDLNYDLLRKEKCKTLTNICDNFNLENYGVPFYFLFPIYGYPKFIFGYP